MALVHQFIDYLKQLEEQGESHVFLDEGARQVLREIQRRPAAAPRAQHGQAPASQSEQDGEVSVSALKAAMEEVAATSVPSAATPAPAPAISVPKDIALGEGGAREKLNELSKIARSWPSSGGLTSLRDKMVFASGDPEADLAFVGDAPGYHEERKKKPFVGPAGQKLQQILKAMGLSTEKVYLTNLVKFRPALAKQMTNDRKPTKDEMRAFLPILKAELEVVQPKVVIALGSVVASSLFEESDDPIEKMLGQMLSWNGLPVKVTFHPRFLLHEDSALGERRKLWKDMLDVMEHTNLPISEKQRGFFQKKA